MACPFNSSHSSRGWALYRRSSHAVALHSNSNHFIKTIALLPWQCILTADCPRFAGDPDPHQAVRLSHRQCHREHAVEVSGTRIAHHEIFTRWVVFELHPQGRISLTPLSCKLACFFLGSSQRDSQLHPSRAGEPFFLFVCYDLKWLVGLTGFKVPRSLASSYLTSTCLDPLGAPDWIFHRRGHSGHLARTCSRVSYDALNPPLGSQKESCARSELERRGRP